MKIVFMGTPDFAAASLKALLEWAPQNNAEITAVYCQPDRPAGRGHKLQTGPVKALALEHNIPVYQPRTLRDEDAIAELAALKADVFAVAAYGLILPQAVLDLPPMGALNVHGSLLPEWRGAAPIQRAVMNGDIRTGVTIQRVVFKLDSGPIILQRAVGIGDDQTSGDLHDELADLGGRLLTEALERLRDGRAMLLEQDDSLATYAAKLSKADGLLDFSQSAKAVHNQARGVSPWPGAQVVIKRSQPCAVDVDLSDVNVSAASQPVKLPAGQGAGGKCTGAKTANSKLADLKVLVEKGRVLDAEFSAKLAAAISAGAEPGSILPLCDGLIPVVCSSGLYGLERVKPAGGKSMDAAAFSNGYLKGFKAWVLPVPGVE